MSDHAVGCTISEGAAGDDDGPSKPTKSAMPTEGATPSARARRIARPAADRAAARFPDIPQAQASRFPAEPSQASCFAWRGALIPARSSPRSPY